MIFKPLKAKDQKKDLESKKETTCHIQGTKNSNENRFSSQNIKSRKWDNILQLLKELSPQNPISFKNEGEIKIFLAEKKFSENLLLGDHNKMNS